VKGRTKAVNNRSVEPSLDFVRTDFRLPGCRSFPEPHFERMSSLDIIVLAVFYDEPHVWSRPPRYRLVAVDRRSRDASHLETSPESPYWIHGRK
jgi:hypothetical protein